MSHALYIPLCIFTLHFPCFPLSFIDFTGKHMLLNKCLSLFSQRVNHRLVNVQGATTENEEQFNLGNILRIKF